MAHDFWDASHNPVADVMLTPSMRGTVKSALEFKFDLGKMCGKKRKPPDEESKSCSLIVNFDRLTLNTENTKLDICPQQILDYTYQKKMFQSLHNFRPRSALLYIDNICAQIFDTGQVMIRIEALPVIKR